MPQRQTNKQPESRQTASLLMLNSERFPYRTN